MTETKLARMPAHYVLNADSMVPIPTRTITMAASPEETRASSFPPEPIGGGFALFWHLPSPDGAPLECR